MKFIEIAQKVIELASRRRLSAPSNHNQELENYLNEHDIETISKLRTLIYAGRDESNILSLHSELAEYKEEKHLIICNLLEKTPLDTYLSQGLKVAEKQLVLIDSDFSEQA